MSIVDFSRHNFTDQPDHFVLLYLLLPGFDTPVKNTYPYCHAVWEGDTLNIVPDNAEGPRGSYHRSTVMLMEEHSRPSTGQPPQNGQTSPVRTSGSPAVPDAEQTQQMAPVTAAERMEPVRKPTVAELQQQHIAALTEISRNLPKSTPPTEHSATAMATIQRARENYERRRASFSQIERKSPPGDVSPMSSISADPVPSRWQSLKQIVRRSDGEQIEMSYQSGNSSAMLVSRTSHRLPKFFKTRKWARRTKRAAVLAFALYAASFWPEPI